MVVGSNARMAAAAGALALGLGWLLGGGGADGGGSVVQPRRDAWSLPELPRKPDLAGAGLALANAPLFEPEAPAVAAAGASAPTAPVDPRWRIAGVFPQGRSRAVLISFMAPGKEPQRLQVGDRLPSGHRIQRIEDSVVCVQIGSKTYRMGVEYRDE